MARHGLLAALILFAMTGAGSATFTGGNDLLENCTVDKSEVIYYQRKALCMGYIQGVADSFACDKDLFGFRWRSPAGVTTGQLLMVVEKYLRSNPNELHYSGSSLVAAALDQAFPCE